MGSIGNGMRCFECRIILLNHTNLKTRAYITMQYTRLKI